MQIGAIVKTRCFYSLPLIQSKLKNQNQNNKSIQHSNLDTFTKKNSLRNLARFHGGLFELIILEIFTIAFLLKTMVWTYWYCRLLSLKTEKNLKKDAIHLKIAWHSKRQKENIGKRERKTNEKKSNNNNKYFFTFTFLYGKNIFC